MRALAKEKTYLTQEGRQNLDKEIDYLMTVRRREVATRLHKASEGSGSVDNAEYEEAKNEQAFVEGRIMDLEGILSDAVVVNTVGQSDESINFGSSVTVSIDSGEKRNYKVVGTAEAAPLEGKISLESPVGRALMGRKVGEEVNVDIPAGVVKLTIRKIK